MNELIELNPDVCSGRAVVRGTRITIEAVLSYLSAGDSVTDVLEAHPNLSMPVLSLLKESGQLGHFPLRRLETA
jgi:uncharacterized protein (DUF433 family)